MTTAIRTGPVHAATDADGSRWYIHPITGERFMSVTTVLGHVAKFGLPDWAARLAAQAAFDRLPWLTRCSRTPTCNSTRDDDACGNCRACATAWLAGRHTQVRDDAADIGVRLHDAAEQTVLFGDGATVDPTVAPYVAQFTRWREAWQPTYVATEATVISRKWGYAGTLDHIARFDDADRLPKEFRHLAGVNVCGDYKTSRHVGITQGWQVAAYAAADVVLLPDGSEEPMPPIGGGLIVHIRPDRVQTREVHLTPENHARFVHLLRVAEGLGAGLNTVLSRPSTLKDPS